MLGEADVFGACGWKGACGWALNHMVKVWEGYSTPDGAKKNPKAGGLASGLNVCGF